MKNKLLVVLAVIGLLVVITIPFAIPVMAAAPVLTLISSPDYPKPAVDVPSFVTVNGIGTIYYGVTFTGSFTHAPTAVNFSGSGVSVDPATFGSITTTSFTADIVVAAGAAHGPRDVTVTTSDGTSAPLYSGILVGEFSYPATASGDGISLSLTPYYDVSGNFTITGPGPNQITTPVSANTTVWYKLTLSQEDASKFDFMGGQLAVRFPHNPPGNTYIKVAGYGALTSAHPDIPEIKPGSPFSVFSPVAYTVDPADRDANGFLIAQADYGSNTDLPNQINGIVEGQGATDLSAFTTISLLMSGMVPPVPELPAGLLFGMGLVGIGGFVMIKRRRQKVAVK